MTDLTRWSPEDIDSLPFGYIGLSPDGTVRKYNRYEADLSQRDPKDVLGRNFFTEVAPCTQVQEFEGRFREFARGGVTEPTLTFDFTFKFRHGHQRVRIGMVRSQLDQEIILTVTRARDVTLSTSAELSVDPVRGRLADDSGRPVVVTNGDFWSALAVTLSAASVDEAATRLHEIGFAWGGAQVRRVEAMVQRDHAISLRESELHVALEYLSSALGVLGLGRFDVELGYRSRGLLLVSHWHSPFAAVRGAAARGCALLAGLHAGQMSHLAGRSLAGLEYRCGSDDDEPCRMILGTQERLGRLLAPAEGSADAALLVSLGLAPEPERVEA